MEKRLAKLQQKYDAAVKHYNFLLSQKDKAFADHLSRVEHNYRSSWKWKIGSMVVDNGLILMNLLKNPVRFIRDQSYRTTWNGYNFRQPVPSVPPSFPVLVPEPDIMKEKSEPLPVKTEKRSEGPGKEAVPEQITRQFTVAAILSEETRMIFRPCFAIVTIRPDNWHEVLEKQPVDLIFIESDERANSGSWRYHLTGEIRTAPDEYLRLLGFAREKLIPSLFWLHGSATTQSLFRERAHLADQVVTFQPPVQPSIHHPLTSGDRMDKVCFKGNFSTIFSGNEAAAIAETLLAPAREFNLEIWDDESGDFSGRQGCEAAPEPWMSFYRGRLRSGMAPGLFRQCMALLHFQHPSDHRDYIPGVVFESLACGTPVICNEAPLLRETFGDTLLFSGSQETTRQFLRQLSEDPTFRWRIAVKGWRLVMQYHRVDLWLGSLAPQFQIPCTPPGEISVSILTYLPPDVSVEWIIRQIKQQKLKPDALVLLSETPPGDMQQEQTMVADPDIKVIRLHFYHSNLPKNIMDATGSTHFAVFSPGCIYGENYLSDYALAARFYNAGAIGKCNYFNFANGCLTELKNGIPYNRERAVPLATVMLDRQKLVLFNFLLLLRDKEFYYESFDQDILTMDPLNFFFVDESDAMHNSRLNNIIG